MKFATISVTLKSLILTNCLELNYYGKRLKSTKLAVIETVLKGQDLHQKIEAIEVLSWLDENKPEKPETEKRTKKPQYTEEETRALLAETHANDPRSKSQGIDPDATRFIVTSAQNATAVNVEFLTALKTACKHLDAELVILGTRYFPDSLNGLQRKSKELVYHDLIKSYMLDGDAHNDEINFYQSAQIIPTAKQPVNTAKNLNEGEKYSIVGSPKQQIQNLPRSSEESPRYAMATGSVTVPNYSDSRAGAEAVASHLFGAIYINLNESDKVAFSSIEADIDGGFNLNDFYYNSHVYDVEPCQNVVTLGDLHAEAQGEESERLMVSILQAEKPLTTVLHDILHMQSANPHEAMKNLSLYKYKHQTIEQDLNELVRKLVLIQSLTDNIYCVESNHNDMLQRLINDKMTQIAPKNMRIFHKLSYQALESIDKGEKFNTLENGLSYVGIPDLNLTWGEGDKSYIKFMYDFSQHGHVGCSGSRGSVGQVAKIGRKLVTGHVHSGQITTNGGGRVITVGTSADLDQGYNRLGFTTWDQSYSVAYPNNTACLKAFK